jgi:hypothetical protein
MGCMFYGLRSRVYARARVRRRGTGCEVWGVGYGVYGIARARVLGRGAPLCQTRPAAFGHRPEALGSTEGLRLELEPEAQGLEPRAQGQKPKASSLEPRAYRGSEL